MKILICTPEYYPKGSGIANIVYFSVQKFAARGHTCTVLSMDGADINYKHAWLAEKLAGLGIMMYWCGAKNYINAHYHNYDVIWLHNPLFLSRIKATNIVSTVNNTYVKYYHLYKKMGFSFFVRPYYLFMKLMEEHCYTLNKFRTSIPTHAMTDEMLELGIDMKNIKYIPNGVDISKFYPRKEKKLPIGIKEGTIVLLCVGRISYQKNPHALIEVMKIIAQRKLNIALIWAGAGELFEEVKSIIDKDEIRNIHLLGKVAYQQLEMLYARCDVYILPSLYEGQPLTLLEAMSSGLPPIVSNIPNMSELIYNSNCGLVVDFNQIDIAADQIINYIQNADRVNESIKARMYMKEHHDWNIIIDKYIEWFMEGSGN